MARHRSSVRRYHDRVAGRYDHSYDDAFWQWHDSLTWDHLKGFLPTRARAPVVDLGCGTGKWGAKLLKSGFAVTFVDISPGMVDQARRKTESMAGTAGTDFQPADISDLSKFPAGHFELAVAFGEPIGCTPDPVHTLREIRRILTADGVLVATLDNRLAAVDHYVEKGDAAEVERFLRDGKTHWLTRDRAEQFPIIAFNPRDLQRAVQRAGFELVDMIGKTVLPMRYHRHLLAEPVERRRWAKIEKSLWRNPDAVARAPHLQIVCRVAHED